MNPLILFAIAGAVIYFMTRKKNGQEEEQPDPEIGDDTSSAGPEPSPEGPGADGPGPEDRVFSSDPESPDYAPIISTSGKGTINVVEAKELEAPEPEEEGSTGLDGEQEITAGGHQADPTTEDAPRRGALRTF